MRSHSSRDNHHQHDQNNHILPQFSESGWVSARHQERSSSRNSKSEKISFPSHKIDDSLRNSRDQKFNQGTSLDRKELPPSKFNTGITDGTVRKDLHLNSKMNKKYSTNQKRLRWEELKVHLSAAQSDMFDKQELDTLNASNRMSKKEKNIIIPQPAHKIINLTRNMPNSSKNSNHPKDHPDNVKKQINLDSSLNKSSERVKHQKGNEYSKSIRLSQPILDNARQSQIANKENQQFLEDFEIIPKPQGKIQSEERCFRQPSSQTTNQKTIKTPPSLEQFLQQERICDGSLSNSTTFINSEVLNDLSLATNNSHNICRNSKDTSLASSTTKNIDKTQLKQSTIPFRHSRASSHCSQYSNSPPSGSLLKIRPFVNKRLQLPHQQLSLPITPRASSSCSTTTATTRSNPSSKYSQYILQPRYPHNNQSTRNSNTLPLKIMNTQELQCQQPVGQQCCQGKLQPQETQKAELTTENTPNLIFKRSTLPQLIDPLPKYPHLSLKQSAELQNQEDFLPISDHLPSCSKTSSPPPSLKIPQSPPVKKVRFSIRTQKGSIPSNPHKINQDRVVAQQFLGGQEFQHLFGVCDGHGSYGHEVSEFVKNNLIQLSQGRSELVESNPVEAIVGIIGDTNKKLSDESGIEISLSGSTVCVVFFNKQSLFCANVGDSRAILGRKLQQKWSVLPLSRDHKPNDEKEAIRVNNSDGRIAKHIDAYGNEIGPERVYLRGQKTPGLAMTRSLGDSIAESVGVIWTPEIIEWKYTDEDSILVVGSDGLFEFMNNKQILRVILPFYESGDLEAGCDALLTQATESWKQRSSMIDDISFVIVFISK